MPSLCLGWLFSRQGKASILTRIRKDKLYVILIRGRPEEESLFLFVLISY
jgi:hypothetical protein